MMSNLPMRSDSQEKKRNYYVKNKSIFFENGILISNKDMQFSNKDFNQK